MTTCGTGGWIGPLPGDPDNNVTLSAASGFGGVRVSWTFPATFPYAVAHIIVFRSTDADFNHAVEIVRVNSSFYFDPNETNTEVLYYYWISVVSVNGTYGDVVGPVSATSRPAIHAVIENLTAKIDASHLGILLGEKISSIALLDSSITDEIAARIAANTALGTVVSGLEGQVDGALTVIEEQSLQRIADNTAMAAQLTLVAADLNSSIAGVAEELDAFVSESGALASWKATTEATLNGNTATGQIGLVATVAAQDGVLTDISAEYFAKLDVNGLIGGFGVYNDGATVDAGFDVDFFWVGRTTNKVKPFIIDGTEVFIDQAVINKLTFTKLVAADGSLVVEDGKIKTDYIETKGLVIRDMAGTILFGAGTALDWGNVGGTGKPADGATRNVARGNWVSGTAYAVGDSVLDGGYGWECILAHTSSGSIKPPTFPVDANTYWVLTVIGGADGIDGIDGLDGTPGQGQVKAVAFIRGASATAPGGGSFASPVPTGSPVWSDGIPADNNMPLWMTTRIFTSDGLAPQQSVWTTPAKVATPSIGTKTQFSVDGSTSWHDTPGSGDAYMRTGTSTDNGATWTYAGAVNIKGETGLAGINTATVFAYRRSASALGATTSPGDTGDTATGASSYVFSSKTLTLPVGSAWTTAIPAGTNPLYVSVATAANTVDTDSIPASEWSDPVILVSDGVAGTPGINSATVYLYMRTATNVAPNITNPAGSVTYTFATSAITGTLPTSSGGTWSTTIPTTGAYLWITMATAASTGASDTIAYTEWSTPRLHTQDGGAGQGQVKGSSFIRLNATPGVPTGGSFASPVATTSDSGDGTPVAWADGIPADNNKPLWMSTRLFTSDGAAPQQATWTTPARIGVPSVGVRHVFSVLGTTPSIGVTDATWHVTPSTLDVYMAIQTSVDNGTTWGAITGSTKIKGEAGTNGTNGTTGTRGSRTLYDVNSSAGSAGYNSLTTYVYGANAAGSASYAAKATDLIATATSGSSPTTPIKGDTVVFSNGTSFVNTLTYTGAAWAGPGVVMDGSLLVTGSVTAAKINTNGLDIRDGSGNLIFSAGLAPTNMAYGVNLCYNADFSQGLAGWTISANSFSAVRGINLDPNWAINGGTGDGNATHYVEQLNTTAGGYFEEESDPISVTSSKTYCLSAYTGAHSCNVDVFFTSYDAAGVALANHGYLADSNNVSAPGGKLLTAYKRHKVIATLAANASYIKIRLRKFGTISPAGYSFMFVGRVQFEEVGAAAVAAGPWSPPNNAISSARQITASNITTYMASAAIGALQVQDAAITSAKIGNLQVKSANIEDLTVGTGKLSANASSKTYVSNGSVLTITIPSDCASVIVMAGFGQYSYSLWTDPGYTTVINPGQGNINLVGGGSLAGVGAAIWGIENPAAGTAQFTATGVAGACGSITLVVVVNKR